MYKTDNTQTSSFPMGKEKGCHSQRGSEWSLFSPFSSPTHIQVNSLVVLGPCVTFPVEGVSGNPGCHKATLAHMLPRLAQEFLEADMCLCVLCPQTQGKIVILPSDKLWQIIFSNVISFIAKVQSLQAQGCKLMFRGLVQATYQATIHNTGAADTSVALQDRKMSCFNKTGKRFHKRWK